MGNGLCSENFSRFFYRLQDNVFSLDDTVNRINEELPGVAEEVLLGRLVTVFKAPVSIYEPGGVNESYIGYENPAGYEPESYERSFVTGEGGEVILSAYPKKGCVWNETDKRSIDFLLQNLFIFCSRARLMKLMKLVEITDALTGALNMVGFMQSVGRIFAMHKGQEYIAAFSNIKNFKYVNKELGQDAGDIILRTYSMMTLKLFGKDGYFCRLGGDNFIAMVKASRRDEYVHFLTDVRIPVKQKGVTTVVRIRLKVGLVELTPEISQSEMMTFASTAMTAAKNSRLQDLLWFKPEMQEKSMRDKGISSVFPTALERNEFLVFYQPKVDIRTNTLCGCEALSRWYQKGRLVPPSEFIPVLEREGSIRNLDFFIFEEICKDIRRWLQKGIEPVRISTNFSKIHLSNDNFKDKILKVLQDYAIDPKYLEIELTESSDYEYFDRLISFVSAMHDAGVHISIDDFGTGYSSMTLIKNLKADVIKLDKSLIDNIQPGSKNTPDEVISRAVINMARELGIQVIAEGVESVFQMEFLKQAGCSMVQGYLYDKPLSHDEFENRLAGSRQYTLPAAQ